jgi:hypothetical protein
MASIYQIKSNLTSGDLDSDTNLYSITDPATLMEIRIRKCGATNRHKADPSMHPINQADACILTDFRHGDVGISSGNFFQFYFDCHNGSPGNPHSEYVSGFTNLRDIGPYAPDQAQVCILTYFLVWEKGSLPATFLNFI